MLKSRSYLLDILFGTSECTSIRLIFIFIGNAGDKANRKALKLFGHEERTSNDRSNKMCIRERCTLLKIEVGRLAE